MSDPLIVRLRIYSQHGIQLLVHSQHGAPTCVRHKPRPEKYFGKISSIFSATSNHFFFRFQTAILTSTSNFSHVLQHGAQLRGHPLPQHFFSSTCKLIQSPTSEHELNKIPPKNLFSELFFQFLFFPNTRNSILKHFSPSSHFENFSSDT